MKLRYPFFILIVASLALTVKTLGETPPSVEYRYSNEKEYLDKQYPHEAYSSEIATAALLSPFRISIDGEPTDFDDVPNSADKTRKTDIALEQSDVHVRFDGLESTPILNVTASPDAAIRNRCVTFTPYSNYAAFITRAELRIFAEGESVQKTPLIVIETDRHVDQNICWRASKRSDLDAVQYVLRVYDNHGHFDETKPKMLRFRDKHRLLDDEQDKQRESLIGYGENHLGIHNIPLSGGAVVIDGEGFRCGSKLWVMDRPVPVDANGKFAYQQIMPSGNHCVSVVTKTRHGTRSEFYRSVYIPAYDWFYTALGDITFGQNNVTGPAATHSYTDGRLAFYLKGKLKNDWLLTASADTQEQPFENLFSNFSTKDPRYLLRRIDPNSHYTVYGDDSTLIEDAPTQGKFYARLEKDDSKIMWGNFQTTINGTDLINYSRGLYGADVEYKSSAMTKFGEKRTEVQGFAANPGTIPALEEFRGTGGSLYYLHEQDITVGSERLRIETRDQDSGIVLQTKYLVFGQDYEINYLQGRVVLRQALPSTARSGTVIDIGALSGNPVYLVADYEYTPGIVAIANLTKGGHLSHWISDYFKLGLTGYKQDGIGINQQLKGADATLRYAPGTYLKLEIADSNGSGSGALSSQTGGFDFAPISQTIMPDIKAHAYRAETAFDFAEITHGKNASKLNAYLVKRDNGYSAPGQLTNELLTQFGLTGQLPMSEKLSFDIKTDIQNAERSGNVKTGEVDANYCFTLSDMLTLALRDDERETALAAGNSAILAETGTRTDGGIKLTHTPRNEKGEKGRYEVYGLAQATLHRGPHRLRNNRAGGGGRYDINDRVALNGEVTGGNGGWGGKAGTEYRISDRTSFYSNYLLDTERSDTGYRGRNSSLATGVKSRYSDSLSVFGEERYQSFDNGPSGLMHAFGLDLAASDRWTWGARAERGTLSDRAAGDINRSALSLSTGYNREKVKYGGTVEWRHEKGNVLNRRVSWLMKNNYTYQTTPDWRFLGALNFAISDSNLNNSSDANYTEFSLGYAYRPVFNDRLNALFKYLLLDEQASPGQFEADRMTCANLYKQRSQVLSADAIYDIVPKLGIGGKIGYRFGELIDTSLPNPQWFDSQAFLAILRADWHVVKEWDAIAELRYLDAKEAQDTKHGALIGIYRQLNDNIKLGVGYNFTDFSDDLTNLSYKSQGFFINLVAKL